ncbi:MAG: glycosyltransferase, partial [Spirochaetaceae bacterium]
PPTPSGDTVLFAVVARIEQRKGQHRFLQAFARALQDAPTDIRAAIVGDGVERAACETLARELGIADRVVFTGFRDNPEDYLAAADVVCLSSEWEGVPQSLVQAAAVGRPAVAFDVPGIREILSDGRTGIVVPYPDIDAFAAAIRTLAADPRLRAEYGAAAATINLDDFRLTTMVSQTESLYRELVPRPE